MEGRNLRTCNHVENNFHLSNKKALLYNLKAYYDSIGEDVFQILPLSFHIKDGLLDKEFSRFIDFYQQEERDIAHGSKKRNIWVVKPGENTNRGVGISV